MAEQVLSLEDATFAEFRERDLRNPVTFKPDGSFPEQIRKGWRYRAFVAGFKNSHPRGVYLGELGIDSKYRLIGLFMGSVSYKGKKKSLNFHIFCSLFFKSKLCLA